MKAVGLARRLAGHELRLFASLVLWVARRTHGVGAGRAFGYARGQGAMMFGFAFVCVVETIGVAVLLRDHPTLHHIMLFLDVYTVVIVVELYAASVVRPHVLDASSLRIRNAAHVDLRIPLERIASVRRETRSTHEARPDELNLAIGAQTTITLELKETVRHFTFLGRRRDLRVIRFHAEEPDLLVREVREAWGVWEARETAADR
ncbi:hypothetical protein [Streptomyces sporangiiformans]|uniref:Uncharacterized protein n=1 Tax=Streptomyces sporangiiformans TaxID=2315329 RepID=A0A505D9B0_9ACTN|nr:hypothetical protein [Streptomyces sporangiiformans]TPQ18952.1 hypothetical protein FGD71_028075 [Streptomyces sporangiiformans]